MVFDRGPYAANAPAGTRRGPRRSPWTWGIGSLVVVIGLLALFAWALPSDEPAATGALEPAAPAIAPPAAPAPGPQ